MSSRVFSDASAEQVAVEYVAERYPTLEVLNTATLKLEPGWLVEIIVRSSGHPGPGERALVMVNRYGFVEEMGAGTSSRRSAAGCLAGLRKKNEIDLR